MLLEELLGGANFRSGTFISRFLGRVHQRVLDVSSCLRPRLENPVDLYICRLRVGARMAAGQFLHPEVTKSAGDCVLKKHIGQVPFGDIIQHRCHAAEQIVEKTRTHASCLQPWSRRPRDLG